MGCLGEALSVAAFGFARTLPALLAWRLLLGALCGNVVTLKSVLAEMIDEGDRGRVRLLMPIGWSMGAGIGPICVWQRHTCDNSHGAAASSALFLSTKTSSRSISFCSGCTLICRHVW
jgi:MFS family permease